LGDPRVAAGADVEIVLQRARERFSNQHPRIVSDNGPQFIARNFKQFIRIVGMSHIMTSAYYPQSNDKIERPVLITALPRSRTTLLLEWCARVSQFAYQCYRDMPFVLTPCLWSSFSAGFRQAGELRKRACGDGMLVNVHSPEALEDLLWTSVCQKMPRIRLSDWITG
jgi:transposase InsO family protein